MEYKPIVGCGDFRRLSPTESSPLPTKQANSVKYEALHTDSGEGGGAFLIAIKNNHRF